MLMIVNVLIFIIGLVVYAGYGIPGLICLLAAACVSYVAGLVTKRFPWAMWLSVGLNALVLLFFKGQHLTGLSLAAPLGVSYYTLQLISYNVDIYRGKYEPERNLFRFMLYVTYLPHLFMGPIESYDKMRPALFENRRITWDGLSEGAIRALWGAFKKLVIATRAGVIVSAISADPSQYRGGFALAAVLLYSVQLYADFSGGIDMVLGISRMLGIPMSENFDAPYFSQSFREFWRRWHMTLGGWLREYVYIPLGGNRKGNVRKFLNTVVTFLVSGAWHGLNYLLWGLLNGIFVFCGERFATKSKTLNRLGTFLLVSLLWSFFVWPDTVTAVKMVASIFTTFNYGGLVSAIAAMGLTAGDWIVFGGAVLLLWGYDAFRERITGWLRAMAPAGRAAVGCALALIVLVFGMYGLGFDASAFIYSTF